MSMTQHPSYLSLSFAGLIMVVLLSSCAGTSPGERVEEFRGIQTTLRPFNLAAEDISEAVAVGKLDTVAYRSQKYGLVTLSSPSRVAKEYRMHEKYSDAGLRLAYREEYGTESGQGGPYRLRVMSALAFYETPTGATAALDLGPYLYAFPPAFDERRIPDVFSHLEGLPSPGDDLRLWKVPFGIVGSARVGRVVGTVFLSFDSSLSDGPEQAAALLERLQEKMMTIPDDLDLPKRV